MPVNHSTIIVFDFETTGIDPYTCEPIQVAGKAYHPRTLEPIRGKDGQFESLMKPVNVDLDNLTEGEKKALDINKKTPEMLKNAPSQQLVWLNFVAWVNSFNWQKNSWMAPIAAGQNIDRYDLVIADRMNELYCPKKRNTMLFSKFRTIDLLNILFLWFENEKEPTKFRMDTLRPFFGLSMEGGHDALVDVEQTGTLIMKFMKFSRSIQALKTKDGKRFVTFEGSCA